MDFLLEQHKISINETDKFAVILDGTGHILLSNEKWIAYCRKFQLPEALWKHKMNYAEWLQKAGRNVELFNIKEVLDGLVNNWTQLSPWEVFGETYWFLLEINQFRLADGLNGALVFMRQVNFCSLK